MDAGVEWGDVADGDASDGDGFDMNGIGGEGGLTSAGLPGVGSFAAFGERGCVGRSWAAEGFFGFGTKVGRDGNDAGDSGRAVWVESTGVGLWRSLLRCERGGER